MKTTNLDDPATIAAQANQGKRERQPSLPSVMRGRFEKEPVDVRLLTQYGPQPQPQSRSSWVDPNVEYPIDLVLEGEKGRVAHLHQSPGGDAEVVQVRKRRAPTEKGRYAYYSMGESRNNPAEDGGFEFYYSNALDLWSLLQDGIITPEQYEVCLADIEAGIEAE